MVAIVDNKACHGEHDMKQKFIRSRAIEKVRLCVGQIAQIRDNAFCLVYKMADVIDFAGLKVD